MQLQLHGKTALVTGGTAGIGFAIARSLAREGASVTITGRTEGSVSEAVRRLAEDLKNGVFATVTGLSADAATAEGCRIITERLANVDILVNKLGIYESKPFTEIPDEKWTSMFEINVLSGVRLSRVFLPKMLDQNWGRILFLSSEAAISIPPDMIHYAATKTALLSIARGLAETTRGSGVTVNSILPGPTRSAGIVSFLLSLSKNPAASEAEAEMEFFQVHRPTSLLQRLISADEVANLATYLASPLSSATNGAALRVEGGLISSIV